MNATPANAATLPELFDHYDCDADDALEVVRGTMTPEALDAMNADHAGCYDSERSDGVTTVHGYTAINIAVGDADYSNTLHWVALVDFTASCKPTIPDSRDDITVDDCIIIAVAVVEDGKARPGTAEELAQANKVTDQGAVEAYADDLPGYFY